MNKFWVKRKPSGLDGPDGLFFMSTTLSVIPNLFCLANPTVNTARSGDSSYKAYQHKSDDNFFYCFHKDDFLV
jgi:hypothetical protein